MSMFEETSLALLLTSLDTNWHRMITIPIGPVDLLVCHSSNDKKAQSHYDVVMKHPLLIIKDASRSTDDGKWYYQHNDNTISLSDEYTTVAWRPVTIRQEATIRIVDIEHMLEFLNSIRTIDREGYQAVHQIIASMRAAI